MAAIPTEPSKALTTSPAPVIAILRLIELNAFYIEEQTGTKPLDVVFAQQVQQAILTLEGVQSQKFQAFATSKPIAFPFYDMTYDPVGLVEDEKVSYWARWVGGLSFYNAKAAGNNITWQPIEKLYTMIDGDEIAPHRNARMNGNLQYAIPPDILPRHVDVAPIGSDYVNHPYDFWRNQLDVDEFSCSAFTLRRSSLGHGNIAGWFLYQGTVGSNAPPPM